MSAERLAGEGTRLISANKYADAVAKLSQAIKSRPAPLWLLERSKAYLRTEEFDLALYDAEKALQIAFDRANRDLMMKAQMRRAISLHRLERYAEADVVAYWALQLAKGAKANEDDGQQNKVDENGCYTVTLAQVNDENPCARESAFQVVTKDKASNPTLTQAYTWRIQSMTALDKLEPGHPARKVRVIKYPKVPDQPPSRKANQQVAAVDGKGKPGTTDGAKGSGPVNSTTAVSEKAASPDTAEKRDPPTKAAEATATEAKHNTSDVADTPTKPSSSPNAAHVYPTSSTKGPKNWDAIARAADEEKEDGGVDDFFQKLYKDADPDMKRAMMKSYVESNGTSLSTSWKDAKDKHYEISPPEGAEVKSWT